MKQDEEQWLQNEPYEGQKKKMQATKMDDTKRLLEERRTENDILYDKMVNSQYDDLNNTTVDERVDPELAKMQTFVKGAFLTPVFPPE